MREEAESGIAGGKFVQERGVPTASSAAQGDMETQLAEERRRAAWASAADAYETSAEPWTNQTAAVMIGLAGVTPRAELLDLGCGTGGLAIAAQTLGALVTAYDIAPSMIAAASARRGGAAVEFRIGDIRALQDRAAGFDIAVANFSILETGEPEAALREAYRALKPGGRLLWTCWPAPTGGALFELVDAARLASEGLAARKPSARGLEAEAAVAMTSAAGFVGVETIGLPLRGRAEAGSVLEAAEKLDAATGSARGRSQTLEALDDALRGSAVLRAEALLIVAEKSGAAADASEESTPAASGDEAPREAPDGNEGATGRGGLIGLFRRLFGRG